MNNEELDTAITFIKEKFLKICLTSSSSKEFEEALRKFLKAYRKIENYRKTKERKNDT